MEFEQIIKLIETVSASGLTEFHYEGNGVKLDLGKETSATAPVPAAVPAPSVSVCQTPAPVLTAVSMPEGDTEAAAPQTALAATVEVPKEGNMVKSPLVGTFYAAPAEDAEPFVKVGDHVKKGQTLAIVEAMKLMNEIESDYDGVVTAILVQNGDTVEYGMPLFCIA